jgi:hypothetical protein
VLPAVGASVAVAVCATAATAKQVASSVVSAAGMIVCFTNTSSLNPREQTRVLMRSGYEQIA